MSGRDGVSAPPPALAPSPLEQARAVLRERWGHSDFRGPQGRVVEAALAGRDVLAVLPTGLGKSVCFQVPACMREGVTLVVSPLIALIEDQVDGARARGLRAFGWTSGAGSEAVGAALAAAAGGELDLLYVSPERLRARSALSGIAGARVAAIAVDEAHCVSQWGHTFRPDYLELAVAREALGSPPATALTATATARTRRDIERLLALSSPVRVLAPGDRPNLYWAVEDAGGLKNAVGRVIAELGRSAGAAIVYAGTRERSARLAIALSRRGIAAAAYHAGLDLERRTWTQRRFMEGRLGVICATSAFGMGIDHPRVRQVLHLGAPGSIEAYVQEAGRAGRDGRPSRCLLIAIGLGRDGGGVGARLRRWRARLTGTETAGRSPVGPRTPSDPRAAARRAAMSRYLREPNCRRAALAAYFGEPKPRCGGCDNCDAASVRRAAPGSSPPRTPAPRRRSSR